MKLSRGFYCFGCHAQGDVVAFVSKLFEVSSGKAARKLSADFGISVDDYLKEPPAVAAEGVGGGYQELPLVNNCGKRLLPGDL